MYTGLEIDDFGKGMGMTAVSDLSAIPGALVMSDNVAARLREMVLLEADWDSYGAVPIHPQAIALAQQLSNDILLHVGSRGFALAGLRVDVLPLADGGVQVEWAGPSGRLDVEVTPERTFNYLLMHGQGDTETFAERENAPRSDVLRAVDRLFVEA